MSVLASITFMGSMMNANKGSTSHCGRSAQVVPTVCLQLPLQRGGLLPWRTVSKPAVEEAELESYETHRGPPYKLAL